MARPEREKAAAIQRLQQQGRVVTMAGDGINDAPARRVTIVKARRSSGGPEARCHSDRAAGSRRQLHLAEDVDLVGGAKALPDVIEEALGADARAWPDAESTQVSC